MGSCAHMTVEHIQDAVTGRNTKRRLFCKHKYSIRKLHSILKKLPNSVGPASLLKFLYWFSQRIPIEQLMNYTGMKSKTASKCFWVIRWILTQFMLKISLSEKLGDA